jgi:hypothetical protein
MTHNTSECHKYEKDGTLKNGFSKKTAVRQKFHGNGKKVHANPLAKFMERFSKLKRAVKKIQKSLQKRKRHQEYSNSTDSDSE